MSDICAEWSTEAYAEIKQAQARNSLLELSRSRRCSEIRFDAPDLERLTHATDRACAHAQGQDQGPLFARRYLLVREAGKWTPEHGFA